MPRGHLTKDIIKTEVLKLKTELDREGWNWSSDPKSLANKYLNKVLDKIEEYAN